jgi:hypothetical protein
MAGKENVGLVAGKEGKGKKICPKGMIEVIKPANSSTRPIASIMCIPYVKNPDNLTCPTYDTTSKSFYIKGGPMQNLLVDIDANISTATQAFVRPGCQIGKIMTYDGTSYLECKTSSGSGGSSSSLQSSCREGYDLQPYPMIVTKIEGNVPKKVCNDNTLVADLTNENSCDAHGGNKMTYTLKCQIKTITSVGSISYDNQLTCINTFEESSAGMPAVQDCSNNDQIKYIYNFSKDTTKANDRSSNQCIFDTNTYDNTSTKYDYTDEKGVTKTYNYVVDELGRQVNFKRAVSIFLVNDCRLCL